jgi:hypothetical protein
MSYIAGQGEPTLYFHVVTQSIDFLLVRSRNTVRFHFVQSALSRAVYHCDCSPQLREIFGHTRNQTHAVPC